MSGEKKRSFIKVNEEELIEAIKEHKELYDCNDKNFKRHASRNAAWQKISKQVGLSEAEAKKRWRSLRDGFIKHVKQYDEESRGTMLHYDILKFLMPYVTGPNARTRTPSAKKVKKEPTVVSNIIYIRNDTDDNGTEYIRAVETDGGTIEEEEMEVADELEEEIHQEQIEIRSAPRNSKAETVTLDPDTETYTIEEATDSTVKFNRSFIEQSFDSDERFLLSLAPSLKRLNTKKNTMARIKIQQLLFELEFDEKF
uniref:CSON015187 protein n=1 Tax=Culicoides sonorensis TaxID=179676 RepID=A0A336LN41_CULSO